MLDLQWDDPYDLDGATYGASIFDATGEVTEANPEPSFTFTPTASQVGQTVEFRTDAIPSGDHRPDPVGRRTRRHQPRHIDTGSSPEVLVTTLDQAGPYKITVSGFDGDTGDFTVGVRPVTAPSKVSTDFNVLLFDEDGNFLASLADQNTLSGRPSEVAGLPGAADFGIPGVQMVISRHGTGTKVGATQLRNVFSGDLAMTEYADPLSPAIFGHALGKQATGVAAYDPFKSYLPEPYTSPGGDLPVYFNSAGKRYSKPQIRRTPKVAGADRGNTTFFVADDLRDPDTQPNFGGTSASAPHVASIAALALQKAGGPKSLSPDKLRQKLTQSTYAHDLDPMFAGGSASGLKVTATGNQGREVDTVPGSMNDPRFFAVNYSGKGSLKSLTFLGETASPTALGEGTRRSPTGSSSTRGRSSAPRRSATRASRSPSAGPGAVWARARSSRRSPASGKGESVAGQFSRLTLNFNGGLKSGQGLRFGIDRDLAVSGFGGANEGNGADELGGSIFLPQGTGSERGLVFVGQLTNGKKIAGVIRNDLGYGFTPVDGYGLINAEKAVLGR